MKKILFFLIVGISSVGFAAKNVVNSYFANGSLWVQVKDTQTNTLEWFSDTKVGLVNTALGCTGTNCMITNLKLNRNSIYGDVFVLFEPEASLKHVFILDLYKNNIVNPGHIAFVNHHGKNVIIVYINY